MRRKWLLALLPAVLALLIIPLAVRAAPSPGPSRQVAGTTLLYLPLVYGPPCPTPVLIAPANGATLSTLSPLFQWQVVTDPAATALDLQIASDPSFTDIVTEPGLYPTSSFWTDGAVRLPGTLAGSTTYYWRARLDCAAGSGVWSTAWHFTTPPDDPARHLPAPALVSPPNQAVVASGTVTFQWKPVSGALDYLLLWEQDGGGSFAFAWSSGTTYTVNDLAPMTTYVWQVAARNDFAVGYVQPPWSFTTGPAAGVRSAAGQRGPVPVGRLVRSTLLRRRIPAFDVPWSALTPEPDAGG
ncbi:MAG: fibronectin type III domain-containing protein [Chloroflexi bacterium]|nr:fibronectin type III domain-containing protein [Chloroflexota bacterium]